MTKFCPLCKEEKSVAEFAKHSNRPDGLQGRCKRCQSDYGKSRYLRTIDRHNESNRRNRARNQLVVYDYLKTQKCADCFITDPVVLTFDHVRGIKKDAVSNMVKQAFGLRAIFDEIAKCEVRCFNCHMIKDSLRRGGKKWNALNEAGTEDLS